MRAYDNRGVAYRAKDDPDRAIADHSEALRLDPLYTNAYVNRGRALLDKQEIGRAIADFTDAIRLEPQFAAAYDARSSAYEQSADFVRAIDDYNQLLRLIPNSALLIARRGLAFQRQGNLDRAIADFTEVLRLDPKSAGPAYASRGAAYHYMGDLDRGIADYSEAIRIDPKGVPFAYFGRGVARYYKGQFADALADFKQSSELSPKSPFEAVWIDIIAQRTNAPSGLSQANVDQRWASSIVRMFRGEITPAALIASADQPNPADKKLRACLANFYSGQYELRRNTKDEAARLFRLAAQDCPFDMIERAAAGSEIKGAATAAAPTPQPQAAATTAGPATTATRSTASPSSASSAPAPSASAPAPSSSASAPPPSAPPQAGARTAAATAPAAEKYDAIVFEPDPTPAKLMKLLSGAGWSVSGPKRDDVRLNYVARYQDQEANVVFAGCDKTDKCDRVWVSVLVQPGRAVNEDQIVAWNDRMSWIFAFAADEGKVGVGFDRYLKDGISPVTVTGDFKILLQAADFVRRESAK